MNIVDPVAQVVAVNGVWAGNVTGTPSLSIWVMLGNSKVPPLLVAEYVDPELMIVVPVEQVVAVKPTIAGVSMGLPSLS